MNGNDSATIDVSVGDLSLCARAIRYKRIEIVLLALVPPGIARMRLLSFSIFCVAVVALYNIQNWSGELIAATREIKFVTKFLWHNF